MAASGLSAMISCPTSVQRSQRTNQLRGSVKAQQERDAIFKQHEQQRLALRFARRSRWWLLALTAVASAAIALFGTAASHLHNSGFPADQQSWETLFGLIPFSVLDPVFSLSVLALNAAMCTYFSALCAKRVRLPKFIGATHRLLVAACAFLARNCRADPRVHRVRSNRYRNCSVALAEPRKLALHQQDPNRSGVPLPLVDDNQVIGMTKVYSEKRSGRRFLLREVAQERRLFQR